MTHSFPTRRSSVLAGRERAPVVPADMKRCVGLRFLVVGHLPVDPVEHNRAIFGEIELHGLARQKGLSLRQFGGHLRQIHFSLLLYLPRLDRKSTRLNSSN